MCKIRLVQTAGGLTWKTGLPLASFIVNMKNASTRIMFFLMYLLLVTTWAGCMFSSKTARVYFSKARKKQYDAIVVPGVPFENGVWSKTMKGRVYWSKYLYDQGIARNIIYSGSAVYSPYYEGKIMAQYAIALGIPADHVFTEDHAEHSTENIYYSYKLAKNLGFRRIALASDRFQTRLLRKFIQQKIDSEVDIIPFVVDTLKLIEPGMTDPPIDYQQSFKTEFIALPERESVRKRWQGTKGKNIDTSLYN
jgi:uncharacterized SAM-binding protein YcdF (DUF218 family)